MMIVFHSPYMMKEGRNWWEYTVCSVQEGEKELEYLFYMAEAVEEMEEVGGGGAGGVQNLYDEVN
jgi:hypothetical protein